MAIPIIPNIPGLTQWRQVLNKSVKNVSSPKTPWNFTVSSKQGGNYLTWQVVEGADGYVVDISSSGDFSIPLASLVLKGNQNITYFDAVPTSGGVAPTIRYYRVHATAGTTANPQSVIGLPTQVISSNAIAPNDTVTVSVSTLDTTTTDVSQARSSRGNYYDF